MGEVLEDMTRASRERVEKYVKELAEGQNPAILATDLDRAREIGDWLFVFEAARETHMFQGAADDRVLMFEKQEQEKARRSCAYVREARALFPDTYEEMKQRVIAEYGQITSRKPQTVLKVIRGEDAKRYGESSFKAEEEGCHICGVHGHFWKSCKHYNKKPELLPEEVETRA